MSTYKDRVRFSVKRLINFLKVFKTNKRGVFGLGILVFFSIMALGAFVLGPHDPIGDRYLAGDYAKPFWFMYLPGREDLSPNVEMVTEPGFPNPDSLFKEWNFGEPTAYVSVDYDPDLGYSSPGTAVIVFRRDAGAYAGNVNVNLTKEIPFPYGKPKRFKNKIALFTDGAPNLQEIEIRVDIINSTGYRYHLWDKKIRNDSQKWITPKPPIDSYQTYLLLNFDYQPARFIFRNPDTYTYALEITFKDRKPGTLDKKISTTVYIDDLTFKLYGTAFGLLGTDHLGRDVLSQLVWGSRISLEIGLLSAVLSVVLGLLFGLTAGYLGPIVDEIMMRFTDMLLVIPTLPLLLVLMAVLGTTIWNLVLLIGLLGWMGFARVVRSQVLSLKERPFVEAAKAVGAGRFHIITKHILPNVMSLIYVSLALSVPTAITAEAALSWLGLYDPTLISWGRMLHDAQFFQGYDKPWWIVPPGLCIAAISLAFILLGYSLDDILNPKLRARR